MVDADLAYTSPAELKNNIEQVEEIETDDYTEGFLIPVGIYLSQSRIIKVAKREKSGKKYISAEISFPNGIQSDGGSSFGAGQYPLRTWATSLTFVREGQPGATSGIAEYLKKVGFDVKQLKTSDEILDALEESQNLPVKVLIGWTNKSEKLPDGTYAKEFAKTRDFNTGTKEAPAYVPFFIKDGEKVEAKHKVNGFKSA